MPPLSNQTLLRAQTGELLEKIDTKPAPVPLGVAFQARALAPKATPAKGKDESTRARRDLSADQKLRIVDNYIAIIQGVYCHLPQKRAAYAVDPVQALMLLRLRLADLSDVQFHLALTDIITGLRDAHTRYSGRSRAGRVAQLPFLVESYGPDTDPRFVVSKVSDAALIEDADFVPGVELLSWNGIPFARAVEIYSDRETGGRPDARRARALDSLTFRSLEFGPGPDEHWVEVSYRAKKGKRKSVRFQWRVVSPRSAPSGVKSGSRAARFVAADPAAEQRRRAKKLMFSGKLWAAELHRESISRAEGWLETTFQDALAARRIDIPGHPPLGYLRIWTFDVDDDDAFLAEAKRLLEALPQTGLIVDIRANPGGLIWAAERLLQMLTPNRIMPTRFTWLATPLTRAMAQSPFNRMEMEQWEPSLQQAISTGDAYAQPLHLTEVEWCNDLGQVYGGPVVCVADANTYSSGDLFAAGVVDNEIGPLVCVGQATGAGGANVWTHVDLRDALRDTPYALAPVPEGTSFTMAIRRCLRAGGASGLPIEDVGVSGIPYDMTIRDLTEDNVDLLRFCAEQLRGLPRSNLRLSSSAGKLIVETAGVDRIECYVSGSPVYAANVADGRHVLPVPAARPLEVVGRAGTKVVQRRKQ